MNINILLSLWMLHEMKVGRQDMMWASYLCGSNQYTKLTAVQIWSLHSCLLGGQLGASCIPSHINSQHSSLLARAARCCSPTKFGSTPKDSCSCKAYPIFLLNCQVYSEHNNPNPNQFNWTVQKWKLFNRLNSSCKVSCQWWCKCCFA